MMKKKAVSLTASAKKLLISKICDGMTIPEACAKYPNQLPTPATIYRKQVDDIEFAKQIDSAYGALYMIRDAELDRLSSGLASEHYPSADFREAEAALKRRIDALKFGLGKMAPVMSSRFNKATVVDHKGLENLSVGPQIVIMDYSKPLPALEEGITIDSNSCPDNTPER